VKTEIHGGANLINVRNKRAGNLYSAFADGKGHLEPGPWFCTLLHFHPGGNNCVHFSQTDNNEWGTSSAFKCLQSVSCVCFVCLSDDLIRLPVGTFVPLKPQHLYILYIHYSIVFYGPYTILTHVSNCLFAYLFVCLLVLGACLNWICCPLTWIGLLTGGIYGSGWKGFQKRQINAVKSETCNTNYLQKRFMSMLWAVWQSNWEKWLITFLIKVLSLTIFHWIIKI